jgi:hypothetical protein
MLQDHLPAKLVGDAKALDGTEAIDARGPVGILAPSNGIPVARDVLANAADDHVGIVPPLHDPAGSSQTPAAWKGEYPAVQYTPPDESFYIDILMRLGEAFSFADLQRDRVPFGDLIVNLE